MLQYWEAQKEWKSDPQVGGSVATPEMAVAPPLQEVCRSYNCSQGVFSMFNGSLRGSSIEAKRQMLHAPEYCVMLSSRCRTELCRFWGGTLWGLNFAATLLARHDYRCPSLDLQCLYMVFKSWLRWVGFCYCHVASLLLSCC
ncbi:hypothetical protein U1Q18_029403 [Sarracenia purpurea var. burkii]